MTSDNRPKFRRIKIKQKQQQTPKLTIIGSDNGLSPERRQAIIWTNAGILLIGPLGTNFSEILIEIQTFSLKKIRLKMSTAKCCSFCLGLNVLTPILWYIFGNDNWYHHSNFLYIPIFSTKPTIHFWLFLFWNQKETEMLQPFESKHANIYVHRLPFIIDARLNLVTNNQNNFKLIFG